MGLAYHSKFQCTAILTAELLAEKLLWFLYMLMWYHTNLLQCCRLQILRLSLRRDRDEKLFLCYLYIQNTEWMFQRFSKQRTFLQIVSSQVRYKI